MRPAAEQMIRSTHFEVTLLFKKLTAVRVTLKTLDMFIHMQQK